VNRLSHFTRELIWFTTYPVLRQIRKLENLHSGQECYIFGDGQSVKKFELSAFANKIGIAVNAFPRHRDAWQLDLRYWLVAEPGFFLPPLVRLSGTYPRTYRNRLRLQSFYRRRPSDSSNLIQITSITNLPGLWTNQTYYFWDKLPRKDSDRDISTTKAMFAGSMYTALTIAQYLGFKKAFLIGFDYTHSPATSNHWYENVSSILSPTELEGLQWDFFETMLKHIEIVTVTPTPQVTRLPSIDYKSLTGYDLGYRENSELLALEDLEVLDLVSDYKIF